MEINNSELDGRAALNARLWRDLLALGDRKQYDLAQRDREWLASLAAQPDPALASVPPAPTGPVRTEPELISSVMQQISRFVH